MCFFLIEEPSKSEKNQASASKHVKKRDCEKCDLSTAPKRCRPDESLELDECRCPRCVCKPTTTCPPLDYDICTRGFKPVRQPATTGQQCCDSIICVSSASSSLADDLTISVKVGGSSGGGGSGNDFYIDENSVEESDVDDHHDVFEDDDHHYYESSLSLSSSKGGGGGGNNRENLVASDEKLINLHSFQYDSNQVIVGGGPQQISPKVASNVELTRKGAAHVPNPPSPPPLPPSPSYYDSAAEQIRIDVKGSNRLPPSENEYYLDEKDYGEKTNPNFDTRLRKLLLYCQKTPF